MSVSKYEHEEFVRETILADDISLFPQKAMPGKITYAGQGVAEKKNAPILVRLIKTKKRGLQFAFEFTGNDYHVEDIAAENPDEWRIYGKFHLSPAQTFRLINFLVDNWDLVGKLQRRFSP